MDTRPQSLPYARPDVNRPPPDDGEVRVGGSLQLLLSMPCVMSQVLTWLDRPRPLTAASAADRLTMPLVALTYPTLAVIVYAGSLGRCGARRRCLYRIYMVGTATLLAALTGSVLLSPPTSPREPLWLHVGGLLLLLVLNPAAVWIGGRWVIRYLFPPKPRQVSDLAGWQGDSAAFPTVIDDAERLDRSDASDGTPDRRVPPRRHVCRRDVLPGFAVAVADLFPPADAA